MGYAHDRLLRRKPQLQSKIKEIQLPVLPSASGVGELPHNTLGGGKQLGASSVQQHGSSCTTPNLLQSRCYPDYPTLGGGALVASPIPKTREESILRERSETSGTVTRHTCVKGDERCNLPKASDILALKIRF